MSPLNRFMFVHKLIACLSAFFFLLQQVVYAQDLIDIISQKEAIEQTSNFAPAYLVERSKLTENTVSLKQIIENAPGAIASAPGASKAPPDSVGD